MPENTIGFGGKICAFLSSNGFTQHLIETCLFRSVCIYAAWCTSHTSEVFILDPAMSVVMYLPRWRWFVAGLLPVWPESKHDITTLRFTWLPVVGLADVQVCWVSFCLLCHVCVLWYISLGSDPTRKLETNLLILRCVWQLSFVLEKLL